VCFEGDNTCDYWCKQIGSAKDVTERMSKLRDTLSDVNADWEKRTDAVRLGTDTQALSLNIYYCYECL